MARSASHSPYRIAGPDFPPLRLRWQSPRGIFPPASRHPREPARAPSRGESLPFAPLATARGGRLPGRDHSCSPRIPPRPRRFDSYISRSATFRMVPRSVESGSQAMHRRDAATTPIPMAKKGTFHRNPGQGPFPVKSPAIKKNLPRFARDEKERKRLQCPDESGVEVNP